MGDGDVGARVRAALAEIEARARGAALSERLARERGMQHHEAASGGELVGLLWAARQLRRALEPDDGP